MKRSNLIAAGIAFIGLFQTAAFADEKPVTLMGYGTVAASFGNDGASFKCEDREHADILLDKLKADLTWDGQSGIREIKLANGAPAYQLDGAGVLVVARIGNTVRCFAGDTPEVVTAMMKNANVDPSQAAFSAAKPRPASVDYFDLNATRMSIPSLVPNSNIGPLGYSHDDLARVVDTWGKLGIGMGANLRHFFGTNSRVDGPVHTFPIDYEMKLAKEAGMSVNVWIGPTEVPWWLRDKFPDQMDQSEGLWSWQKSPTNQGAPHMGLFMNDALRAYADRYDFDMLRDIKKNIGNSLSSIRVATGRPGDEMAFHSFSTELMDRSESDFAAFRQWIQSTRHLDMAVLGTRWYGDANHFHSWDEVKPPSMFEFFGSYGQGTFDLNQGWLWHPDSEASATEQWEQPDYKPGPDWTQVDLMTSLRQDVLISSTRENLRNGVKNPDTWWFRKQFDATPWLKAHARQPLYLAIDAHLEGNLPAHVYLNGIDLGELYAAKGDDGFISTEVTSQLLPGTNTLCIKLTKEGVIHGPVFLTSTKPASYPYLGVNGNARWIDLRDWLLNKITDGYARIAKPALEQIPDVPILLVTGGGMSFADDMLALKKIVNFSAIHDTGSGSSFQPMPPGLAYALGLYSSCEEGAAFTDPKPLTTELNWFLLEAVSEHNYVGSAKDYLPVEAKTHWFSDHRRYIQLLGKALWVKPKIAMLRSSKNAAYISSDLQGSWDLGRGPLEATHRNNVYLTESEVKSGIADGYPVLIDDGTVIMDQDTVAAIKKYVENGGTFIALSQTGRHLPLEPDTWPISDVTGFKVTGTKTNELVTIDPNNPLLKSLSGMTFLGEGMAVNWLGVDYATGISVGLEPVDSQAQSIAHWEDGSVAAGMRALGKGRVITLGSTFWRIGADRGGGIWTCGTLQTKVLNEILDTLGVKPEVDCDNEHIWTRREFTKNGLQDWVLVYNPDRHENQSNVTVSFDVDQKPGRLFDVVTGADVPFDYADGKVKISGLTLEAGELRVIGLAKGNFAAALPVWFAEKTTYWKRQQIDEKAKPLPAPPYTAIVFDKFHFRIATPAAFTDLSWLKEPLDNGTWKEAGFGFWDEMGYPALGVGLYRTSFTLPPEAANRRYNLGLVSFDTPVFYGNATIYLNGQKVMDYKQHYWSNFETVEITGNAHPGRNNIAVIVEASEVRGGYGGQMAVYPLVTLHDETPLTEWKVFESNTAFKPVSTPINTAGYFVRTNASIPASWAGKPIYLELNSTKVGPAMLMVNGRAIPFLNSSGHPVGGVFQTNISLYAKPGESNEIEIWFNGAIPFEYEPVNRSDITLNKVSLGIANTQ